MYARSYHVPQVVTHCSHGQLEGSAETLWTPLFDNSENSEEITRNVAAACLGKLSTTNPSKYLPQLHVSGGAPPAITILTTMQNRITDSNPAGRATVVAAIRYTFAESSPAFDELLGPMLIDFLSLMLDPDLVCTFSKLFNALWSSLPLDRQTIGLVRSQLCSSH